MSSTSTNAPGVAKAAPFWMSLGLIPLAWFAAFHGGWSILLLPLATWGLFTALDFVVGEEGANPNPDTPDQALVWHRLVTLIWPPIQLLSIFGILLFVIRSGHLTFFEMWALFAALGILSGTIGIVYAHELVHQKPKLERWLGDILMTSVLYGHWRSEHLLVHHRYVGTPRDSATARYGESFYRFFVRVVTHSVRSSFRAEAAMLARKNLPWYHQSNPFWLYLALQTGFVALAWMIGGGLGIFLFVTQAFWAVFQLELVDYIEHYGLTRKHLGDGKYEHVLPRHSWNATQKASNWLLINLQRHSDHHYKPNRRFPLLQTYNADEAPQLPHGYPVMTVLALFPRAWKKMMNPRVKDWRDRYYPDVTDWGPYKAGTTPMPR